MFAVIAVVASVLIAAACVYAAVWFAHKRERDTANRMAGDTKRAGRHRAEGRPTMKWRG